MPKVRNTAAMHEQMRGLFREALARVDVRRAMAQAMAVRDGQLCIGELCCSLEPYRRVLLVAMGKAALPMTETAVAALRPALRAEQALQGIAVSGELSREPRSIPSAGLLREIRFLRGSHPVPDRDSREAAEAVVNLLRGAGETDLVLFLLSGGASSLVELPADPAITLEQTAEFYQALLHSGLPITGMNTLRKHFSAIKGGQLAALAAPATQCSLLVSDVPGEALDVVGSGPSLPDPTTLADCRVLLDSPQGRAAFGSPSLRDMMAHGLRETPKPGDAAFARTRALCLLSNETLVEHARLLAAEAGYLVVVDNTCDDWNYREATDYLLGRVRSLRQQHSRVCVISGGEVTVTVPAGAGVGGRNQHFALYAAMQLAGTAPETVVLSAGSDGVDGNSPATGAIADNFTVEQAERLGLSAADALERFDSYPLFQALGDAVVTGPTGNNVRDLRVLVSG